MLSIVYDLIYKLIASNKLPHGMMLLPFFSRTDE